MIRCVIGKDRRGEGERKEREKKPVSHLSLQPTSIAVSGETQFLAADSVLVRCCKVEGDTIVHARPESDGAEPA